MSGDGTNLRRVVADTDAGYYRSYGDLGRAIMTLRKALARRDETIRQLRKSATTKEAKG